MRTFSRLVLLTLIYALSSSVRAQEDESAWTFLLDSIVVRSYRYQSQLKSGANNEMIWNLKEMSLLPQILGNADPMRYAQMLPGVQTNNEYRSGVNIEGCDNQHNLISIFGVPIYNVNHLLGFFSAFNNTHFANLSLSKGVTSSAFPNRIGGQLDLLHPTSLHDSISGNLSVGIVSSQGTLRLPLGKKTSLTTSLRASYLNLFYSKWLNMNGSQLGYFFYDANATLMHQLDPHNKFMLDFYSGHDDGMYSEQYYFANTGARWGNNMLSAHWIHLKDEYALKTTAYFTNYRNKFEIDLPDMLFKVPSGISDVGIKSNFSYKRWSLGLEGIWHKITPQSVLHDNGFNKTDVVEVPRHSFEISMYGNYVYPIGQYLTVSGGLRGSLFLQSGSRYGALDPSLRVQYENANSRISATYALRHQYLFQVGFSDWGLPTEFWISSDKEIKPQYAHELSLSGSTSLFDGRFRVSADLFFRKLYNQLSYKGNILDFVNTNYNLHNSLLHGKGTNYGFSLMLNKCTGNLTGWMSYTYTKAERSYDEFGHTRQYPANHERPHEFNAVATYSLGKHWEFGGTFVLASGTPFTAAESIYLLNHNLIIKYSDYNSSRLRPYLRLDVSVNYKWQTKNKLEHGFNLSLYNISCRKNEVFYYLSISEDGKFSYQPESFILTVFPSVSYFLNF